MPVIKNKTFSILNKSILNLRLRLKFKWGLDIFEEKWTLFKRTFNAAITKIPLNASLLGSDDKGVL